MDLKKRLQENMSTQEKHSIVLTILVSLLYFVLYFTLGGGHIITIGALGLLGITILILIIVNTLQEFQVYSDEETVEKDPVEDGDMEDEDLEDN